MDSFVYNETREAQVLTHLTGDVDISFGGGFTIYLVLVLKKPSAKRPHYILDLAGTDSSAGVSIFLDPGGALNFRIRDATGNGHVISLHQRHVRRVFNRRICLRAQLDLDQDSAGSAPTYVQTLAIDNTEIASGKFSSSLPGRLKGTQVIGADSSQRNHGRFGLYRFLIYDRGLTPQENVDLTEYLDKTYSSPPPQGANGEPSEEQ